MCVIEFIKVYWGFASFLMVFMTYFYYKNDIVGVNMRNNTDHYAKSKLDSIKKSNKTLTQEQLSFLRYLDKSTLFVVNGTSFELVMPVSENLTHGANFSHLKAFIGKNCDLLRLNAFEKIALMFFQQNKIGLPSKSRSKSVTFGFSGSRIDQIKSQESSNPRSPSAPTLPISIPKGSVFNRSASPLSSVGSLAYSLQTQSPLGFLDKPRLVVKPLSKDDESKRDTTQRSQSARELSAMSMLGVKSLPQNSDTRASYESDDEELMFNCECDY